MMNFEIPYADESTPISNPPRVLMADGIWLVPPEMRPTVRTPPPDPVKAETRDWAMERVVATNIAKETRQPPTPKVKPPRREKPPKVAKIPEPPKPRLCVDCGGPRATHKSKRCVVCRDERIKVLHNLLRAGKRTPRIQPTEAETRARRTASNRKWRQKNLAKNREYQNGWAKAKRVKQKTANVVL